MWWFSKISVFCLSGHLSAGLSRDIYVLDFFDFLYVGRNMQKSRPISVEKGKVRFFEKLYDLKSFNQVFHH